MSNPRDGAEQDRPNPLYDAARQHGRTPMLLGAVVAAGAVAVLLGRSGAGADLLNIAAAAVAVLSTGGTSVMTLSTVLRVAYGQVTPTEDPRSDTGEDLVPVDTALVDDVTRRLEDVLRALGAPPGEPAPARWPAGAPAGDRPWPPADGPRSAPTRPADQRPAAPAAERPVERTAEWAPRGASVDDVEVPRTLRRPADPAAEDWYGDRAAVVDLDRAAARHPSGRRGPDPTGGPARRSATTTSDAAVTQLPSAGRHHRPGRTTTTTGAGRG